jgi:hypothetical protein
MVTRSRGFNWKVQVYAGLVAMVLFVAINLCRSDTALFLYLFIAAPVLVGSTISLMAFLALSKNHRWYLSLVPALAIVYVIAAATFLHGFDIRTRARWLVWSHEYKTLVLAQPQPSNGGLKHIEWDGWGAFGQDFSVFLVFDPEDSLSGPAGDHLYGKFSGIPCEVDNVRRLDAQWYTVLFDGYVDARSWDSCR